MRKIRLFPDGIDRERMLDMDRRLRPVRRVAFLVLAGALLATIPWVGWWSPIPLILAIALFSIPNERLDHPEYAIFAAFVGAQVIIAVSVVLAGFESTGVPVMSWFAIPVVTLGARFSGRVVAAGVGFTIFLMVAVALIGHLDEVVAEPPVLLFPAAMVMAIAILSTALMQSDVEHRSETLIDPLTGMLNRKALESRTEELTQQALYTGEPIAVIVGDLDHFKQINDSLGHSVGDAVLKDVAYLIRKELRAFDLAYRLGGEEFLVLVPGAGAEDGGELAERLRRAVSGAPVAGQDVTISFGVSASERGTDFDYDAIFAAADAALYEAKEAGRDRVCVARWKPAEVAS